MKQRNRTPFDDILGCYNIPLVVRHNKATQKSYLFVGDKWHEIGTIDFIYTPVDEESGFLEIHFPDCHEYAEEHKEDGAMDWLQWGPGVN